VVVQFVAASFQLAEGNGKLETCRHKLYHYPLAETPSRWEGSNMAKQHSPRFEKLCGETKQRVRELTVDDVAAKLDKKEAFYLVDVREESEWAKDHLPGAVHLGKGIIERDIEQRITDCTAPIVLYCGGGFRSALAADNLQKMGYTNVWSMDGGIRGWRDRGYPLTQG
jgi:rhodanese-related sulfurtransferase